MHFWAPIHRRVRLDSMLLLEVTHYAVWESNTLDLDKEQVQFRETRKGQNLNFEDLCLPKNGIRSSILSTLQPWTAVSASGTSSAGCWVWATGVSTTQHYTDPYLWVKVEQGHYTGLCSNHGHKQPRNKLLAGTRKAQQRILNTSSDLVKNSLRDLFLFFLTSLDLHFK